MSLKKKVHVIGAGIAGYSAAIAFLKHDFEVFIWEKENAPFQFSSSRNSAMARSYEADPYLSHLLKRSLFLMSGEKWAQKTLIEPVGLLIKPMEYDYEEDIFFSKYPHEPGIEALRSRESSITLPNKEEFAGLLIPGNGFLNLGAIHEYFKEKASGAHTFFYKKIKKLEQKNGRLVRIIVQKGDMGDEAVPLKEDDIVVNAAGSWAHELLKKNSISAPKLIAHKRHMFLLENPENWFTRSPIVWDEVEDFYIKYHEGNLLVSPCDESIACASDYGTDPRQIQTFQELLERKFTFLKACNVKKTWSCLRTFTLDDRPIVGFDPNVRNLFWCAGWGGRGVSMSLGMVEVIERQLKTGRVDDENEYKNPFSAHRFG